MARLRLTLHKISCYADGQGSSQSERDLKVSTEKGTDNAFFQTSDNTYLSYQLNLVDFGFKKKMYQPTEITAVIHLKLTNEKDDSWKSISRKVLDGLFKFKQVTLEELDPSDDNTVIQTIGDDFYVHEVLVRQKPDTMYITLKIYSLDKLLTLKKTSRTFVSKRLLNDILKTEMSKYKLPYESTKSVPYSFDEKDEKALMKHLYYTVAVTNAGSTGSTGVTMESREHIHPYLVQYNESFYDMLARTANRWGEFLFYENGQLNIGYDDKQDVKEITGGYRDMTYVDLGDYKESLKVASDGKYDYAGAEEKGFINNILRKTPGSVSGCLFKPGDKGDKVAMKVISGFLKNEKNLPTYLSNLAFDSTFDLVGKELANLKQNNDFDDTWFPDSNKPCNGEHYGEHNFGDDKDPDNGTGLNLFSEIDTKFKESKYTTILAKEQSVGRNAVCIDFEARCPKLKLGSIIKISGEQYIVVEISSKTEVKDSYGIADDDMKKAVEEKKGTAVTKTSTTALTFQVVATAQDSSDSKFYPAVIPSGHVRQADPQIATITNADDPDGKNRVRVMFSWQTIDYEPDKKDDGTVSTEVNTDNPITEDTKKASSPWLTFTAGSAGSPVVGKHYEKDEVLIGFIDGNVERPYVLGCVTSKGSDADYVQTTPGGHQLTMTDDEEGIASFLNGMFLPGISTITPVISLIPGFNDFKETVLKPSQGCKNNIALGGGFELADKYGIYKISGSTDGREVSIASPWGDVNINAFTGITLSAPNGDVTIKGKNVTIEAGNNLEITSGTNVRYKLLGESLDKGAGGVASAFFGNMAGAVSKKLAQAALNIIDLSMIRNVLDIIFRPAEGNMRIKSNRYMMLESGKGECDYPSDAYKDAATVQKVIQKKAKADLRPGLKLSSGVVEMIARVQTLGNKIEADYRAAYNKCVDLRKQYEDKYAEAIKWSDDYDRTKTVAENPKICSLYTDLKEKVWKADPVITEADLDLKTNYKLTEADVQPGAITNYDRSLTDPGSVDPADKKKAIVKMRGAFKESLFTIAKNLQKAIADLQKMSALSEKDIKALSGAWKDRNMPENFQKALITAFKKDKLGDTFFYKEITAEKKKLEAPYDVNDLQEQRKALKRKAAITLLEEMGFKDEWRKPIIDTSIPAPAVPAAVAAAPGVPVAPPAPPAPPQMKEVPKKTDEADLTNGYWTDYVQSLAAVPPLSPVKWKIFEEAKKAALGVVDNLYVWKNIKENMSWGDAKKGAILFSFDENVYQLDDKKIEEVNIPAKENLTEGDDTAASGPVGSFLNKVRTKLNSFD